MREVGEGRRTRRTEVPTRQSCGAGRATIDPDSFITHEEEIESAARRYGALLRGVARRILGDDESAKDAVQEALVSLWMSPEAPKAVRSWLVRTVVHRSLHARRTRDRRRRWEDEAGRLASEDCPLCDPERQLEAHRSLRFLEAALESLSEEFRMVLLLHEVEGLEYQEIALRLAVPVGTVRSRLNRARRQVRARCTGASAMDPPSAQGAA